VDSYISLVYEIANYLWIATILVIIAGVYFKANSSTLISLTLWLIIDLIAYQVAPKITAMDGDIKLHVWYTTWIAFDAIGIWLLLLLHTKLRIAISKLSLFTAISFFALLLLQAARYIDRIVLETNMLAELYKFCIPAIQFTVPVMAVVWLCNTFRTKERVTQ